MRRLTRRTSHLVREQAHIDNSAWRVLAWHASAWRSRRAAPRWPRVLRLLVLCTLAIPLCLSPPPSAAGFQRSALIRPVPSSGDGGAIGQPSPPAQAAPILGDHPAFTRITTEQGLSDDGVRTITQDSAGFLWFGTLNGLDRYDGYEMIVYRNDPANPASLSDNTVTAIYEDREGTLWVGTRNGLNVYDRRTDQFTRYLHDPANPSSLSEGIIYAIYEDRTGTLWIGTEGGLNRFDRAAGAFIVYRHDPQDPASLSHNYVAAIHQDRAGTLWVVTYGGGLDRFDPATGRFTAYRHDEADPHSLSSDNLWTLSEDRAGMLWVGTWGGGLDRFDPATGRFTTYRHDEADPHSLSDDRVMALDEDDSGALWVGTWGGGLNILDSARQRFSTYQHDPVDADSLSYNGIVDIFRDRSGLIWLATTASGVNLYNPLQQAFTSYRHNPNDANSLASNTIQAVFEDHNGILWLGTQEAGLDRFDRQTGRITHYPPDPTNPQHLGFPTVADIQSDQSGALWVATYGGGLYHLDTATGVFSAYRHDPANPHSLSNDSVTCVREDQSGRLWVATEGGGLNRFDPASGTFTAYRHDPADPQSLTGDSLWWIQVDRQGMVWSGGTNGLNRLDPSTGRVSRFQHDPQNPASLSNDFVYKVYEDRAGTLWVATWGSGLDRFDPATEGFIHYGAREGLPRDNIYNILEDGGTGDMAPGNLWIVLPSALAKLDRASQTIHIYDTSNGLPQIRFTRGSSMSAHGELLIGSQSNGLLAIDPASLQTDPDPPPLVFTDFWLANKPVAIGDNAILKQVIDQTDTIKLTYADHVISFEFAALSYRAPRQNRYRYMLEGFDTEWSEVDASRRLVTYTNLNPGTYVFRVTGSNGDGVWNEAGRAITLVVTPPWWATWWFRGLAIALIAGLGTALYLRRVSSIQAQRSRLEIQVAERTKELVEKTTELEAAKNQAESANQVKSMFLATMSHELRTPLSVILGFTQILARSRDVPSNEREYLATIQRSGEHLLSLINSVLDLAKIEAGRATLNETTVDLVRLADDLKMLFQQQAADKGLGLRVELADTVPRYVHADALKLRQVLVNLLGNALKFTETGRVTLRMSADQRLPTNDQRPTTSEDEGSKIEDSNGSAEETLSPILNPQSSNNLSVVFEIEDTGPGITLEEQAQIFEPFVQTTAGVQTRKGTGLGLAISRQYIQLMGGTLQVRSQPGRGARFIATIPFQVAAAATSETEGDSRHVVALAPGQPPCRILVVDDQPDNRQLLITLLAPLGFELREAGNGQEAVAIAQEWQPQLIWMDLRMPLLDGYAAAHQIKASGDGQPPVIIAVSASSGSEERDAVLAAGCDDFIRKPFRDSEIFTALTRYLGVRFIYADAAQAVGVRPSSPPPARRELDVEGLAALPADILNELERSIVDANPALIGQSVARVRTYNAGLADVLAARAERFEHARILACIEAARDLYE